MGREVISTKKSKSKFKMLFDSEDLMVGERKLKFSLYILHRVWLWAIVELLLYVLMFRFGGFTTSDVVQVFTLINWFILTASGAALGVYSYGNVQEWKYRTNDPYAQMGGNMYNPPNNPYSQYGGGGQFGGQGAFFNQGGGNAININVAKQPGQFGPDPNIGDPIGISNSGPPIAPSLGARKPLPVKQPGT